MIEKFNVNRQTQEEIPEIRPGNPNQGPDMALDRKYINEGLSFIRNVDVLRFSRK